MELLFLVLTLSILAILAYRFWEPFTATPKREVSEGSANIYFFYTDWCGFSQKAMPTWEALEAQLAKTPIFGTTRVKPIRVNAESDKATATLYGIEGYPTIKLETSTALIDFSGKRTVEGLLNFLRETLGQERSHL
jgi:thiol-disulfide isomerase/thioredoxin